MEIGWPQIIYIGITFMGVGLSLAKHGEQKVKTESIWTTLLGVAIVYPLLYWGGFFS